MAQCNHTRHAQFTCTTTFIKAHPLNATMQSHGLHAPSTNGRTTGSHKEKTDNQSYYDRHAKQLPDLAIGLDAWYSH